MPVNGTALARPRELTLWPSQPKRIYALPPSVLASPDKWLAQIKKNGHRAIVRGEADGSVSIMSRHGERLSAALREDWTFLREVFRAPFVLDGELIGPRQAGARSDRLVVWDAILMGGASLLRTPYSERFALLRSECSQWEQAMHRVAVALSRPIEEWEELWRAIDDPDGEDEGLVFKRCDVALPWHATPCVETPHMLKLRKKG